jgi:hypothetical protein
MADSDDSPLPKPRKKHVLPDPQSMLMTPESPLNLVIKRPAIRCTPPEPARRRSSRESFLSNPLFEHEAKEVDSDGITNTSVSDYSSDDDDADDSCVTHGSHPDGSVEIYRQGQLSQADNFSTPLHHARHRGRVPLHQELEDRFKADKAARKSARLAAEAVAATASLLAIPIPDLLIVAPNPLAGDQSVPLAGIAAAFDLPQRKITIPLMFQLSRHGNLPVPPQPVAIFSPRTPVLSPVKVSLPLTPMPDLLSFDSRIIPETPVPKLPPSMPSFQPFSGPQQSRMKLSTIARSISVQTVSVTRVATASIAVQTHESDADLPITFRDLRSELESFLKGIGF